MDSPITFRTLDQRGRGDAYDPNSNAEIVKPGELVDIRELSPLTLTDRRIYNLLLHNAWDHISEPIIHRIPKSALRGSHSGNERIENSLLKLMGTIAIVTIRKEGKPYTRRVQLLGASDESLEQDGYLHYRIPDELIEILRNSEVYARLKTKLMYSFRSKYALCIYEMIEKRIGLEFKRSEVFSIEDLRGLLNVPAGKLLRFADLNKHCIKVALDEVNRLCPFYVDIKPLPVGRRVDRVEVSWWPKTASGKQDALDLLDQHSVVRRAKMRGLSAELPDLIAVPSADG